MESKHNPYKKHANSFGAYLQMVQNISSNAMDSSETPLDEAPETPLGENETIFDESADADIDSENIQSKDLMTYIAALEPITVAELMRKSSLNFLDFARRLNVLLEVGLVELTPSTDAPSEEIVRLSRLGHQALLDG